MCFSFIWCVFLLFSLDISESSDSNNIYLTLRNDFQNDRSVLLCDSNGQKYTLLQGVRAEVVVKYKNTLNNVTCYYSKNNKFVYTYEEIYKKDDINRIEIKSIAPGQWSCEILTNYGVGIIEPVAIVNNIKYTRVLCDFNVHYRLLNGPQMYINGKQVTISRTELATTKFDYIGEYFYKPDTPVNVTCIRPSHMNWINIEWRLSENKPPYKQTNYQVINNYTQLEIHPTTEYYGQYLDCTYGTNVDELRLRVFLQIDQETMTTTDTVSSESSLMEISSPKPESLRVTSNILRIVGAFLLFLLLLLFIILMIYILCVRVCKKKDQPNTAAASCENLISGNTTRPNESDCIYSQPLDENNDCQYSEPYRPALEELYSKPIPKSDRHGDKNPNNLYAEVNKEKTQEVIYAELSIQNSGNPESSQNKKETKQEAIYSELYAEAIPVNSRHYENLSNNQRYVNSDARDDYAEPAYCELLVKRVKK